MKCRHCGKKIALAKFCPYCGEPVSEDVSRPQKESSAEKGEFKGRFGARRGVRQSVFSIVPAIVRYFRDPDLPAWRKMIILFGVLYIISPVDLLPGAIYPVLGWIDDAVVAAFTWKLLKKELDHHDNIL